jgi:hypothetical protein
MCIVSVIHHNNVSIDESNREKFWFNLDQYFRGVQTKWIPLINIGTFALPMPLEHLQWGILTYQGPIPVKTPIGGRKNESLLSNKQLYKDFLS